ncbi:MAG: exosortase F system-associated protein [Flavobacteriaceae bacterium]|nr:exosortase F system-associated protein [Flavobacteriaceae bacterium]
MNKATKILFLLLLVSSLIAVRALAPSIFYDPLIAFFKSGHLSQKLPEMNLPKLVLNTALRFWINTAFSLGILWVLFQKKEVVKFSGILYSIVFIVLLMAFCVLLQNAETTSYMPLFYVRRFLIHPIVLLLLIPAFYFQQTKK